MASGRECGNCHRYAYHRCRYCGWVRNPTRPPDHSYAVVMAVRLRASGTPEHKTMSRVRAAKVMGARKGGLAIAAAGTAHRWTTETARKAAIRSWTKRRKFNKRIQARVGMKVNKRPSLWREPLRAYYAEHPTRHITCRHEMGVGYVWWRGRGCEVCQNQGGTGQFQCRTCEGHGFVRVRRISERAALTALGHLSSKRGFVPDTVTAVPRRVKKQ